MHRLLTRQLRRYLGKDIELNGDWQAFLDAISSYYGDTDEEKALLENALSVNSDELTTANEQLRAHSAQEHALLRGVMNSIPDLIFFKTSEGVYLGCNLAFEKYMGTPESTLIGKTDSDFMDAKAAAVIRNRDQIMLAQSQPHVSEEWVNYPNGDKVCLEMLRTPYSSADRKPLGLIGIGRDITERKRLESEMSLAALVYQHTREGILVTDTDNRIIAINPACSQITGYELDEVLGKNPSIFSSGRQDRAFYQSMWQAINSVDFWHGEIWDRRKGGAIYAKSLSISRLKTDEGAVRGYVALFSDITQKKQSEELIWHQANFDVLTGLPNRRMFRDRLEQEIKKDYRAGFLLALLFIDLDHFKEINDTLGHLIGDELLIEAARRISACTRESDTVARLGGDEFTVILPQLSDSKHIEAIAQKIIARLADPFLLGNELAYVTASVGVTLYPDDATQVEQLIKNADQAMYVAKNLGRNRLSYFTMALQEAAQNRLRLINDLHGALAGKQFHVYFQPILDLAGGRIQKAEALLRWQHPVNGMIGPTDFIALAEETGLIIEIGDWVFQEVARWVAHWKGLSPDGFQASVNMSPVQFKAEDNSIQQKWIDQLDEMGLSGNSIVIEITEGLLLNMDHQVAEKLHKFRNSGIQVAIDDFGTGYSSLAYLKKFEIDFLKIDQSFVRNLACDVNDKILCEAIIVMAHKLGIKVIAEGVETQEQKDLLSDAGCDYVQGYLFSKPLPPEEFEALLKLDLKY